MTIHTLLLTHRKAMLAYAKTLTRDVTAAEDVVQTACVNALMSKTLVEDIDSPRAWLKGCVRHAFFKRAKTERRYVAGGDAIAALEVADGAQSYAVELQDVRRTLDGMTQGRRDAFLLVAVEGMDGNEAGAVLGISRGAVSYKYRMAKAELLAA